MAIERRQISLERVLRASLDKVWGLWTTKAGVESWWGPDGFTVEVREIDVRVGGRFAYAMTAAAADQVDFLRKAGMPISQEVNATYVEVAERRRLAFDQVADFIPGVKSYSVRTAVDLEEASEVVRMLVTIDAMHDAHWTELATTGWKSQLDRLTSLLDR